MPSVRFVDPDGQEVSLREIRGRPVVTVFAATLPFPIGEEDFLRAELRGLGAALVVITLEAAYFVGGDDALVELQPLQASHAPPQLFTMFAIDPKKTTLVVHGEDDSLLWRHETDDVIGALRAAASRKGRGVLMNRREVLLSSLVAAVAATLLPRVGHARDVAVPQNTSGASVPTVDVTIVVNGQKQTLHVEPRVTLLDGLREVLGLTGTKKGCDHGQCGACTVLVDGTRTLSCLTLAVMHEGAEVTTIEGLARGDTLHPVQAAFLEHDAFQCGYCTPGQIMSAVGMLAEGKAKSHDEIREAMSGNICRCGAYPNIIAALASVRRA